MKVKITLKNSRPQNQWLTFDKEYSVIDEFWDWQDEFVLVISNDRGEDANLYTDEFEVIE